jgi:hypothetical protein
MIPICRDEMSEPTESYAFSEKECIRLYLKTISGSQQLSPARNVRRLIGNAGAASRLPINGQLLFGKLVRIRSKIQDSSRYKRQVTQRDGDLSRSEMANMTRQLAKCQK